MSVGRQPWAAGNSPVTQYMIANKTFERFAADAGYDLTIDYRDYPSALPMVEAFVSGNLDFGMWGNTPIVRLIAQNQPIQLLTVGEGHFRFVLATRKDSPIRNIADLKGKTVGALLGGDPYNVLLQMLRFELGNADPEGAQHHRRQHADAGAGRDDPDRAWTRRSLIYPAFLKAQRGNRHRRHHELVRLHREPLQGTGRRRRRASCCEVGEEVAVLSRRLLPAPLVLDRASEHHQEPSRPSSSAFVLAQQDAVAKLSAMDAGQVSELVAQVLGARPEARRQVVKDDVLFARGWCWPTEGDAAALLETSKYMVDGKMIPKPLAWAQVRDAFALAAPARAGGVRQERAASPTRPRSTRKDAKDLRGAPVWDLQQLARAHMSAHSLPRRKAT